MRPKPNASEYQRHQALIRKPGPVRRLTADEIRALEHKRRRTARLEYRPSEPKELGSYRGRV